MRIEEKYNILYNKTANQYTQVKNSLNLNKECIGPVYSDGSLQFHKRTVNDLKIMNKENCVFSCESLTLSATNSRINGRSLKTGHCEKQETDTQNGLNSWISDLVNNNIMNGVFTPKAKQFIINK